MEDHTIVSLVAILSGVGIVIAEIVVGQMNEAVTLIAAGAIGAGLGVPIGTQVMKREV